MASASTKAGILLKKPSSECIRGLDDYRHTSSFRTWFFRIVTNIYRNTLRSKVADKRSGKEMSLDALHESSDGEVGRQLEPTDPDAGPLATTLDRERLEALEEAIEGMPDKMRHAMMLRLHHDMSYQRIATVMQVSIDTVKAHLHHARRRLAELRDYYRLDGL